MSTAPTHEELAQAAMLGDTEAVSALFEAVHDKLLRRLQLRCGNLQQAEDAASAAWAAMLTAKTSAYDPARAPFLSWLCGIGYNELNRVWRRQATKRERLTADMIDFDRVDSGDSPDEIAQSRLRSHRLCEEVARLTADQAEAIRLKAFVGMTFAEIGAVMGKTPAAAAMLHQRGMTTLRKRLGPDAGFYLGQEPAETVVAGDLMPERNPQRC